MNINISDVLSDIGCNEKTEIAIYQKLFDMGISSNYKGYKHIIVALSFILNNEYEIYKKTAETFNDTINHVSDYIRRTLSQAWDNPKMLSFRNYFIRDDNRVPSKDFLIILAEMIEEEIK